MNIFSRIEPRGASFLALTLLFAFVSSCTLVEDPEEPSGSGDLSALQGDWYLVDGNNPNALGMHVDIDVDEGTVIDPASTSLNAGDTKWRNIRQTGDDEFEHEELGSDRNYYPATMEIVGDTALEIRVQAAGAGNVQSWRRNPPSIPATVLDRNYFADGEDRTLVNTLAAIDYRVTGVMDITVAVTIEPGVVIEFEEDAGFGVYDSGSLNAVGTASQPIVFQGSSSTKGYWRGIHLETNSVNNQLEHVQLSDAGSDYVYCCNPVASLYLKDGSAELGNLSITNGAGYGIATGNDFIMKRIDQTDISGHEDYPVSVSAEQLGAFSAGNYDFTGNDEDFIYVYNSAIREETTWYPCGLPFLVENVIDITRPLTIEPGTEVAFAENAGLGVYDNGSINAVGTPEDRIRFSGKEAVPGYWRGIHVETNSNNNRFEYVELGGGGSNYVYCCNEVANLLVKRGQFTLQNSFIYDSGACGVFIIPNAEFIESGNTFANNEGGNICQ